MNIDKLLEEFKTYKINVEGKAEDSMNLYIKNIKKFCEDMNIKDYETLISTKAQTIKDWLSILAEKENSAITRNNKSVSRLYFSTMRFLFPLMKFLQIAIV